MKKILTFELAIEYHDGDGLYRAYNARLNQDNRHLKCIYYSEEELGILKHLEHYMRTDMKRFISYRKEEQLIINRQ